MRIAITSLLLAGALAGCQTKVVSVPIPVKCISAMPPSPHVEFDSLPDNAKFDSQVRALLIDHATFMSSLKEHRALMAPCVIGQ